MKKIKISEFTIERIKNEEFKELVPELYELKKITENNPWHNNENVFNHTITVVRELDKLIAKAGVKLKKEILILGTIFHDIGKLETFTKDNDSTKCLGHEVMGSEKMKEIIKRFDLSEKEQELVVKIVKNHGVVHDILSLPKEEIKEQIDNFKLEYSDIFLELLLLAKADLLGSQLKINKPEEFKFKLDYLNELLINYS